MTQINTPLTDSRLDGIEHHLGTVLLLSAVNLIMNVLTIAVGFLIAM